MMPRFMVLPVRLGCELPAAALLLEELLPLEQARPVDVMPSTRIAEHSWRLREPFDRSEVIFTGKVPSQEAPEAGWRRQVAAEGCHAS
jgi:hypothetical protein